MRTLYVNIFGATAVTLSLALTAWSAPPEDNSTSIISRNTANRDAQHGVSDEEMHKVKEDARNTDTFAKEAAQDGLLQIELGKLAESKASSDKVKDFGREMVDDHQHSNEELEKIAKDKGIALPTKLDAEHQSVIDELKGKSGKEFDSAYSRTMRQDHQKAVTLFKDASTASGVDSDLQAFAKKILPKVEEHRSMALELANAGSNPIKSSGAGG